MSRPVIAFFLFSLVFVPLGGAIAATDVVFFDNGDRLTGELKSLERGKLRFKTDATSTISIEWDDVASLTSNQNIQVETEHGQRYLGQLVAGGEQFNLQVQTSSGPPVTLEMAQVVLLAPIKESALKRIDGSLTVGYNFAKASEVEQIRFGLTTKARSEKRVLGLSANAVRSDSEDSDASERLSLDMDYKRLRRNRWFTGAILGADRNDELGIDLRTSIGVGGGRFIKQTNSLMISLDGGVQLSRENLVGDVENRDSVEGLITFGMDWFQYDSPQLDFSTVLKIIPNFTDSGRVRGELDLNLRWEMFEDVFWELSFYDSYDSDPVIDGAEKNDFGVSTSLGWKF